jgi:hypothetical protein
MYKRPSINSKVEDEIFQQQKYQFLTSVTLDPCLAEDGSVRNRVNSPELAPLPVNLES